MSAFNPEIRARIAALPVEQAILYWDQLEDEARRIGKPWQAVRFLCLHDLYYLLVRVCRRIDLLPCVGRKHFIDNQFWFDRCREVEANPDGYVDLWSREHGKSSIITFGLTLQDILKNPEITIGIFSHTRPIAKAFLRTLMREIENNRALHGAFPDIFCGTDIRAYAKFSEDDGVVVKRSSNPNESTIEAWGLVDGMPVSKHFQVLLYDDIVVPASVSTPEMIDKVRTALQLSYNLGTTGGAKRAAGTRYHFNDAYRTMIDSGTFKIRQYPGKEGGTEDGESILWSAEMHEEKRRAMGPHVYAAQILLDPKADALLNFQREWMRYYDTITTKRMNTYMLVDPASAKNKKSDYTVIWVIGLNTDGNYYVIDVVRDRLSLKERAERLFILHQKWKPQQTRYEQYGMQADIEHIQSRMEAENYRFDITPVGGNIKKQERVGRLIPMFEQGKFWFPKNLFITDYQKTIVDMVRVFVEEELVAFPVGLHEDMLDSLSRIAEPDLPLHWPKEARAEKHYERVRRISGENSGAWMN